MSGDKENGLRKPDGSLIRQLELYRDSGYYPFHMPGHKRNMPPEAGEVLQAAAELDITEIDGFDDLHQPEGILHLAQERAAEVFGADETFFLVNGSTAGILTAVSAAARKGGRVLVARNCHKSVYHALCLRELEPVFLYPKLLEGGVADAIAPEQVEEMLARYPDIQAVLITSPTYDGVVSDVEAIGKVVHQAGAVLIVDGAHGAHFGFAPEQPESPVRLGADLVVQSLHKTLPALTQTALLHRNGKVISSEAVRRFERIYQTSSPSYLLMGSMDSCARLLQERGRQIYTEFEEKLNRLYARLAGLRVIRILSEELPEHGCMKAFDRGKLLISTQNEKITGNLLYKELLNRYHLQMEMVCDTYVTAILTPWDTGDGLLRLAEALEELDERLLRQNGPPENDDGLKAPETAAQTEKGIPRSWPRTTAAVLLYEAVEAPKSAEPLLEAAGKISATYVNLYPPGIPLIIPGEVITEELIKLIDKYVRLGLNVQGVESPGGGGVSARELTIETIKGRRN
ncbi:MAG TPA: aminotransferase class V-fold PLP-dependent enzyme [Candidatus Eisenbergiella intestinigallinarum]|uniref:Aminotransferase class V-fold PLP-dependent enzyme n=1 Tax=Candidatus Eisenbergiella intestinigallinarum TaxID=2838549 RepID=A0A9D2QKG7_9FIRM|nr:aminotransferase class V-fold PLP-dependent enzyme [Candidatus Eisenbergiella intestinigallinarum]